MVSEVYKGHGILIRQINFPSGTCYEFERYDSFNMMSRADFRKMVLTLIRHLMEAEG